MITAPAPGSDYTPQLELRMIYIAFEYAIRATIKRRELLLTNHRLQYQRQYSILTSSYYYLEVCCMLGEYNN